MFSKKHTPWNKGKVMSEETKTKISVTKKAQHVIPKSAFKTGSKPWNTGLRISGHSGHKHSLEWKQFMSQIQTGRKNPKLSGNSHWNWKGGISNRDIHSLNNPKYRDWRMNVFARDGFKCRIANKDCSGTLQAHHILRWSEYPELRYELNNGISLCVAHHPRKKVEEKRLEPLFRELIA